MGQAQLWLDDEGRLARQQTVLNLMSSRQHGKDKPVQYYIRSTFFYLYQASNCLEVV
jgi:hypothetical protein